MSEDDFCYIQQDIEFHDLGNNFDNIEIFSDYLKEFSKKKEFSCLAAKKLRENIERLDYNNELVNEGNFIKNLDIFYQILSHLPVDSRRELLDLYSNILNEGLSKVMDELKAK